MSSGHGSTTSRISRSRSHGIVWWSSRGPAVLGSRRWPSTRCLRKGNASTWRASRPTHDSFSTRCKSPRSTTSKGCLRPSPSSSEPAEPIRARPSRPPRRFTTTCGFSTRTWVSPMIRRPARPWPASRPPRSSIASRSCQQKRGSWCWLRWSKVSGENFAMCWSACSGRDLFEFASMVKFRS